MEIWVTNETTIELPETLPIVTRDMRLDRVKNIERLAW
jgi:hypothetical protein